MTGGWTDTLLTIVGRNQATLVGGRLVEMISNEDYSLYSSDLLRAFQTAEIISDRLNLNVIKDIDLREINTGIAAGKNKEWARENRKPRTTNDFDLDYP